MSRINACVVGVGHLGSFHVEKYIALKNEDVHLVALVDPEVDRVRDKFYGLPCFTDVSALLAAEKSGDIPAIQVVSVATPTEFHSEVGVQLLEAGKHLLVEKPLAKNSEAARRLVQVAKEFDRVLAVGHVERHRAHSVLKEFSNPRFIECHRLAPFSARSTDINVVLDLMIHDIDLMLAVVGSPLKSLHATGYPVLTDKIDIANARFEFEDGCVANLTSSRITAVPTRKFRVFSNEAYLSLDLGEGEFQMYSRDPNEPDLRKAISNKVGELGVKDALKNEVGDFIQAVRESRPPLVTGDAGYLAQELAEQVLSKIEARMATES